MKELVLIDKQGREAFRLPITEPVPPQIYHAGKAWGFGVGKLNGEHHFYQITPEPVPMGPPTESGFDDHEVMADAAAFDASRADRPNPLGKIDGANAPDLLLSERAAEYRWLQEGDGFALYRFNNGERGHYCGGLIDVRVSILIYEAKTK